MADGGPPWSILAAALSDDFDTPGALAVLTHGRRAGLDLCRGLALFGLRALARLREAPTELSALASCAPPPEIEGLGRGRPGSRDEIEAAGWEIRDVAEPPFYRLVPRA